MIDSNGIASGKVYRRLFEDMESELLLNFKNALSFEQNKNIKDIDFKKWRSTALKHFNAFRSSNQVIIGKYTQNLNRAILSDFQESYNFGMDKVGKRIEKAVKKGFKPKGNYKALDFKNNGEVAQIMTETMATMNRTLSTASNWLENNYVSATLRAETFSSSSETLFQAIDKANREVIERGVVGNITAKGHKINIVNQAELNIVEQSQEVLFVGQAEKANETGNFFVYITVHGSSCKLCTPWQGKILIDDVYQKGVPDGIHELLSTAIEAGLFHYNCRHEPLRFIPGFDEIPVEPRQIPGTKQEQHALYEAEQRQRGIEQNIRKWKREEVATLDDNRQKQAKAKVREWQAVQRDHIKKHEGLYRQNWKEAPGYTNPPKDPKLNFKNTLA